MEELKKVRENGYSNAMGCCCHSYEPPPTHTMLTLALSDCQEIDIVSEYGDEVIVRCWYNRGHICCRGLGLSLKEIVTHRAVNNALPVLLHKYLPGETNF